MTDGWDSELHRIVLRPVPKGQEAYGAFRRRNAMQAIWNTALRIRAATRRPSLLYLDSSRLRLLNFFQRQREHAVA
jgi:hypothetical protein